MSKELTVILAVTAVVVFYWIAFSFIFKRNWAFRLKLSVSGFLLFAPLLYVFLPGNDAPGSEIVIIYPVGAAIVGYILGLIFDSGRK